LRIKSGGNYFWVITAGGLQNRGRSLRSYWGGMFWGTANSMGSCDFREVSLSCGGGAIKLREGVGGFSELVVVFGKFSKNTLGSFQRKKET